MNQVMLVGRIANTPEIKELENDKKVCNITVAVQRSYKNSNGEYETDFINCILWNGVAQNTFEYCRQGDIVGVKGRIQNNVREIEGKIINQPEIVADKITFLSSSKRKDMENEI